MKTQNSTKNFVVMAALLLGCFGIAKADSFRVPGTHNASQMSSCEDTQPNDNCTMFEAFCQGRKKFRDGSVYEGEFSFGKPSGKGTMIWPDGTTYVGEFKNGNPDGTGSITYEDGSRYEGEWTEGLMEGEGAYTWSCGHEYFGSFKNDKMEGEGSILMATGEAYSGNWKEGFSDGFGVFTRLDGSKYLGNFKQGERDGEGLVAWESGDTLRGSWLAGKLDGEAEYSFSNGDHLVSTWQNGKMQSELTYATLNGQEVFGAVVDIEDELALLDPDLVNNFTDNIQLGWYGFAMEHKSMNQLDEAIDFFKMAQQYTPESSRFNAVLTAQISEMKDIKETGGWARINDEK